MVFVCWIVVGLVGYVGISNLQFFLWRRVSSFLEALYVKSSTKHKEINKVSYATCGGSI